MPNEKISPYDHGYVIETYSPMQWAIDHIEDDSVVLDVGCSIGALGKLISEHKACTVDIIEYDDETGSKAKAFARNACIGATDGDLNQEYWFERLRECRYDIITVLDVLEHCQSPDHVLDKLKALLKADGQLIVSVPNIAHNSVILNLIRNRFEYTETGLLDQTHIHFFTYQSARAMLERHGFIPMDQHAFTVPVGRTEIDVRFADVDIAYEPLLRTRANANAYQLMFCCGTKRLLPMVPALSPVNTEDYVFVPHLYYQTTTESEYSDERVEFLPVKWGKQLSVRFTVDDTITLIRFSPMAHACLLRELNCFDENRDVLDFRVLNGKTRANMVVFNNENPCIEVNVKGIGCLCVEYSIVTMDEAAIEAYQALLVEQNESDQANIVQLQQAAEHNETKLIRLSMRNQKIIDDWEEVQNQQETIEQNYRQRIAELEGQIQQLNSKIIPSSKEIK